MDFHVATAATVTAIADDDDDDDDVHTAHTNICLSNSHVMMRAHNRN